MSKLTDTLRQDTPRLVVTFRREGGKELFQWGIVGQMPAMTLIGAIVRVQSEIYFRAAEPCPESALVIAWDEVRRGFDWFLHPDIPLDSLVGMLEVAKAMLTDAHIARQAATGQPQLLGPDGQPMRRG